MASAILLLIMVAASALLLWVSWLAFTGKLQRNPWAGIRTGYTLSSDERWMRTHRSAGPYIILTSVAALAAGLAFLPFAVLDVIPDPVVIGLIAVQTVVILVGVIGGAIVGTRKAKAAEANGL